MEKANGIKIESMMYRNYMVHTTGTDLHKMEIGHKLNKLPILKDIWYGSRTPVLFSNKLLTHPHTQLYSSLLIIRAITRD